MVAMRMADGRWNRAGCLVVLAVLLALVIGIGATLVVALRQNRAELREHRTVVHAVASARAEERSSAESPATPGPGRVELQIEVAQLIVLPAPAGQSIRVESDFDPRYHILEQNLIEGPDGAWTCAVRFVPRGSYAMAMARVKLGGRPPELKLLLPRGVRLAIEGEIDGAFVALELGGLDVEAATLHVEGGAASVSFAEPSVVPMERLELVGDKGSIEVTGLGNASPRAVSLEQRFGELDLDLRGAWRRDAEIRLDARFAGGGVWLPANAHVQRSSGESTAAVREGEVPLPRLRLTTSEASGRLVYFDTAVSARAASDGGPAGDRSLESALRPTRVGLRVEERDASGRLGGYAGTFVVSTEEGTLVHAPERSARRFVPASTFKIPNMLIALETGVADGPEFTLPWDGRRPATGFWARSWSRDHTLSTAFRNSVLWYFQEIARRIGERRMTEFVTRFDYGNRDASGPIDRFWLDGSLMISANEQVAFLRRFHENALGLSGRTTRYAKEMLVLERAGDATLSGKTGTISVPDGGLLAWLVGYVESHGRVAYFALNLDCPSLDRCDADLRRRTVWSILEDWEVFGPASPGGASAGGQ